MKNFGERPITGLEQAAPKTGIFKIRREGLMVTKCQEEKWRVY